MSNRVIVKRDGPLVVYGDITVEAADGTKLLHDDTVYLCRCGHSKNKPFCDGEHKRHEFVDRGEVHDEKAEDPQAEAGLIITLRNNAMLIAKGPMSIESEDGKFKTTRNKAAFCRCGQSENKPFCDANHKQCGFVSE